MSRTKACLRNGPAPSCPASGCGKPNCRCRPLTAEQARLARARRDRRLRTEAAAGGGVAVGPSVMLNVGVTELEGTLHEMKAAKAADPARYARELEVAKARAELGKAAAAPAPATPAPTPTARPATAPTAPGPRPETRGAMAKRCGVQLAATVDPNAPVSGAKPRGKPSAPKSTAPLAKWEHDAALEAGVSAADWYSVKLALRGRRQSEILDARREERIRALIIRKARESLGLGPQDNRAK